MTELLSLKYATCRGLFLLFIIPLSTITCTNNNARNKDKNTHADSVLLYTIPAKKAPENSQILALSIACQHWYDSILHYPYFNGAVLVAQNGHIVFEKYSGTGHINASDTLKQSSPLHIASVSKTFTAMAVLKMVQEGKIALDSTFDKYFPEFNYPGVTIRSLLNHRSGLPNYLYFMEESDWNKQQYLTNRDVLNYMIAQKDKIKNIGTPNRGFSYCNTNYILLALLIEKISGISYPAYIQKNFFDPLQMKNSYVYIHTDSARSIPSYDWRGQEIPMNYLDEIYGDKNIYSTPRDLLIWDAFLKSGLLFKQEILNVAYTPYSNERPGVRNYGLGWRMNIYPTGKKYVYHNGWWHGNNAAFIRLIDTDATIIVLGNRYNRGIYKAKYLTELFDSGLTNGSEDEAESNHTP